MTLWQKLAMWSEWYPLLSMGQELLAKPDAHAKAVVLADMLEWASKKTDTKLDDKYAPLLADVISTKEFKALVDQAQADYVEATK
jgi:hypothetical protein